VTYSEVEGIGYVAGTLDGRHQLVLPAGEYPRDARDGRVLSVRYGPVGPLGVPTTSTVIVRDVTTGDVLVEVDLPVAIASGVLGADTAYVAASDSERPGLVPAVQAISLADGTIREVLPAQDIGVDPDGLPPFNAASGGRLNLSPSGRTLGFCIFQNHLCDIQVVDLEKGSSWVPVRGLPGGLLWLSDDVLVGFRSHIPIIGYDIATGETAWSIEARALTGYILSDGLTLVLGFHDDAAAGHVVATIELRTGERRDLLHTPPTEIDP
jgi:outer membrane protein assembly factor BamB